MQFSPVNPAFRSFSQSWATKSLKPNSKVARAQKKMSSLHESNLQREYRSTHNAINTRVISSRMVTHQKTAAMPEGRVHLSIDRRPSALVAFFSVSRSRFA